jgi:hypothetical protein
LSVWDLIARWNIPMPTTESCLMLITSGSRIHRVKRLTSITPSRAEFIQFLYCTSAGLHQIRSCTFKSACQPGKQYWPFRRGARRLNNGYNVLNLKYMQWWLLKSTKISMVRLIVLTDSSRLSNRRARCILFLLESLLDCQLWWERMHYQIASIAYGL